MAQLFFPSSTHLKQVYDRMALTKKVVLLLNILGIFCANVAFWALNSHSVNELKHHQVKLPANKSQLINQPIDLRLPAHKAN